MSCNCSQTTIVTNPCTPCAGCAQTISTDCVIYSDTPLCFESEDVSSGDKRTLTNILKAVECNNTKESKIVQYHSDGVTNDGDSYTVLSEDTNKVILLTCFDEGVPGTITNAIVLPQTSDFIDKEIIIKDISAPQDSEATTIEYRFSISIQYGWNPVLTSNNFSTLCDATHKTLKLRFVKTTPTSYQWIVCP